jgi:hypothetical protein
MPASEHTWSAVQCPHCSGQMKVGDCEAAAEARVGISQPYIRVTEEEEAAARAEWKYHRWTGKLVVLGVVALVAAAAAVLWVVFRRDAHKEGFARIESLERWKERRWEAQWPGAAGMVERFLAAQQWRDLKPLVLDAPRVEGIMEWYYSRRDFRPMEGPVKLREFQSVEVEGVSVLRVYAEQGLFSLCLLLRQEKGDWKVDWEVFVNANGERWAAFLKEPAGTMVELPLLAARKPAADAYLIKAGVTPDTHEALALWANERREVAAAAITKNAKEWGDLEGIGYDDAVKVIARVKMENPAADPPLVKIEAIVQRGWVRKR